MAKLEKHFKDFDLYLDWIGAEKLPKTSQYEEARFVANEIVCVIYRGKKGVSFSNDEARNVLQAFHDKRKINVSGTKRKRFEAETKERLFIRDGNRCFYTDVELTSETATIEHLIPLSKGGKNNLDNLVLCTKESNHDMGDKPLIEKIKMRDSIRGAGGINVGLVESLTQIHEVERPVDMMRLGKGELIDLIKRMEGIARSALNAVAEAANA